MEYEYEIDSLSLDKVPPKIIEKLSKINVVLNNLELKGSLKTIRKDITLPTTPPKDSLIFKYELKSSYLYEQATKKSLNNFDIKNIPIIKKDQ